MCVWEGGVGRGWEYVENVTISIKKQGTISIVGKKKGIQIEMYNKNLTKRKRTEGGGNYASTNAEAHRKEVNWKINMIKINVCNRFDPPPPSSFENFENFLIEKVKFFF